MSVDESSKVDRARQDRLQEAARERPKVRPQETEFDRILERGRMAQQLSPQQQAPTKTLTEEAIREAARRQDEGKERRRDDEDRREGREDRGRGQRSEGKSSEGRVTAKGQLKQGSEGGRGGREGFGEGHAGRRELVRMLSRAGVRSLPVDLQGAFAGRLAKALNQAAHQTGIAQHVLDKIVQMVRIGMNRKGEKEIRLELSERVFRGLKLRVVSREGGKVSVFFRSADPKARKLFRDNDRAIRDTLARKGIEVDEIEVS